MFPELLNVVNLILLPADGVTSSPIAMLIWTFLILAVVAAVWSFIRKMIGSGGGRRA